MSSRIGLTYFYDSFPTEFITSFSGDEALKWYALHSKALVNGYVQKQIQTSKNSAIHISKRHEHVLKIIHVHVGWSDYVLHPDPEKTLFSKKK